MHCGLLFVAGSIKQSLHQFAQADPAGPHQLRVKADLGKAGQCVELIDQQAAIVGKKEIDSYHAVDTQRAARCNRLNLNGLLNRAWQLGRAVHRRAAVLRVFFFIGVQAGSLFGHNLARQCCKGLISQQDGALNFPAADIALNNDLFIIAECIGQCVPQLGFI